jgi:tRNA pseudouridine55 synthase
MSGEIIAESRMDSMLATSEIDAVMKMFVGEITQIPPMYSAVKVNGKCLYEYAREGISIERSKRKAHILSFDRTSEPIFDEKEGTQSFRFRVECGKGVYIRTLAVDLGKKLGLESHLSDLTRTKSAGINYYETHALDEVEEAVKAGIFEEFLFPIEIGVADFPRIDLNDELYQKVKHGARLAWNELGLTSRLNSLIALFYREKLISIYQNHPEKEGILKPSKVFH